MDIFNRIFKRDKLVVVPKLKKKSDFTKYYVRIGSICYGLFFCLFGVCLCTIEPFKSCTKCENHIRIFIDSFFIFMYLIAIIWLLTMFILITLSKRKKKVAIKQTTDGMNTISLRRLSGPSLDSFKMVNQIIYYHSYRYNKI